MEVLKIFVILLSCCLGFTIINATLDLSNVDLKQFKYFKYPPQIHWKQYSSPVNRIQMHVQKVKAVGKYFKNLLFGNPNDLRMVSVNLHPEFGSRWQPYFQQKYGYRAEHLVTLLGRGLSLQDIDKITNK